MGELVRGDEENLTRGEAPVQQRVVEDDPAGGTEPGDVGVGGRSPPARVRDEHLVDVDAELPSQPLDLGRQHPVGERLEAVEERLHDERLDDEKDRRDRDEGRRGGEPPPAPETPRQPDRAGDRDGDEHGLDGE